MPEEMNMEEMFEKLMNNGEKLSEEEINNATITKKDLLLSAIAFSTACLHIILETGIMTPKDVVKRVIMSHEVVYDMYVIDDEEDKENE